MKRQLLTLLLCFTACGLVSAVDPQYGIIGLSGVLSDDTLQLTLLHPDRDGHDPACKPLSSSVFVTANGVGMRLSSAGGPDDQRLFIACAPAQFQIDVAELPRTDGDALHIEISDGTSSETATYPLGLATRSATWTKPPQPDVRGTLTLSPPTDAWVSGTLTFSQALLDTYEFTTSFYESGHASQYKGDATIDLQGPTLGFLQAADHGSQLPGALDAQTVETATACTLPDGCVVQHHVTRAAQ
jgi:hypothetical protein